MTDLSAEFKALANYRPTHKVRFVTAASLFDGHDAAINIMRRILQGMGAEVIHLGHNRSVDEVVTAALQEDVQGIAISSYQGGHVEYFKYMVDLLKSRGGAHIQVFGGGGGVIVPPEIRELQAYGVSRIYSPEDGQRMGLAGMIGEMVMRCDQDITAYAPTQLDAIQGHGEMAWRALAQLITALENEKADAPLMAAVKKSAAARKVPVLGITGTGGAGKSSLTDELIRRLRLDQNDTARVAVISIDPSRRKSGGALLGDRIRMNAINPWQKGQRVFMRSLATRDFGSEISKALPDVVAACKAAGFDLVIVETSGIGQGDAAIVPHVDVPMYVMTPEFGAASQLEKIDMLDFAEFVAINKFDRKGASDALRDVAKQVQRNKEAWTTPAEQMPVFGTMAARFNDDGVTALYQALKVRLAGLGLKLVEGALPLVQVRHSTNQTPVVPAARTRYLAEITDTVRGYKKKARAQARLAREIQQLRAAATMLEVGKPGKARAAEAAIDLAVLREETQDPSARKLLAQWPEMQRAYSGDEYVVKIRDKEIRTALTTKSLSGTTIRKVALPQYEDHGEILKWLMLDNVPGSYPYTAGTFAFKRENEDPTRMFAGEGDPFRTNRRFKLVSQGHGCQAPVHRVRLGDAVRQRSRTCDPDIYGKIGNSGVNVATLDDMKVLYGGFDLCNPTTSVSMTINGPAPSILAHVHEHGHRSEHRQVQGRQRPRAHRHRDRQDPRMGAGQRAWHGSGRHPEGRPGPEHLHLLHRIQPEGHGRHRQLLRAPQRAQLLQSVSISGYHIAEAGANPISQLAFTLSNGFTLVEAYLARGMHVDDFRAQPELFLQQRHGPGIHRDGPCGAPHLGRGHEGKIWVPTSAARSSSTTSRPAGAACTRRRSSSMTSAPRCRR
jgi:methylmalonyl-CoA mutase